MVISGSINRQLTIYSKELFLKDSKYLKFNISVKDNFLEEFLNNRDYLLLPFHIFKEKIIKYFENLSIKIIFKNKTLYGKLESNGINVITNKNFELENLNKEFKKDLNILFSFKNEFLDKNNIVINMMDYIIEEEEVLRVGDDVKKKIKYKIVKE